MLQSAVVLGIACLIQSTMFGTSVFFHESLLHLGCDFSGRYSFGKVVKNVATRCRILKLKCTKVDFGRGSAPNPAGGAYHASTCPSAGFNGTYF